MGVDPVAVDARAEDLNPTPPMLPCARAFIPPAAPDMCGHVVQSQALKGAGNCLEGRQSQREIDFWRVLNLSRNVRLHGCGLATPS